MKQILKRSAVFVAALGFAGSVMVYGWQVKIGTHAPDFSVTSMSGKQMFFQDMQTGGPVFVYFIRDGDGVSQQTSSYINKIVRAYGDSRSTWYGIINAREDRARSFQAETDPAFRLERDENMSATKVLGVTSAPTVLQFSGKGLLMHTWKGFSELNLKEINKAYARASHKTIQDVDFSAAPSTAKYGNDYDFVTRSSG